MSGTLKLLEKVVLAEKKKVIKSLSISELNFGMIFMQDVVTKSGTKVIGMGQEVSYAIITRLQNIAKTSPIQEPIQVIYTQDFQRVLSQAVIKRDKES